MIDLSDYGVESCPKCGGKPFVSIARGQLGFRRYPGFIHCHDCGNSIIFEGEEGFEKAVNIWNALSVSRKEVR